MHDTGAKTTRAGPYTRPARLVADHTVGVDPSPGCQRNAATLRATHAHGRQRFVELARHITTITPKVLTQRLRQLERDGLVVRTYHAEVPPRVEYEISELGHTLAPLFASLEEWSDAHLGEVEQARTAYDHTEPRTHTERRTAVSLTGHR